MSDHCFPWTPETYRMVLDMIVHKRPLAYILDQVPGLTKGIYFGKFLNRTIDENLFGEVFVDYNKLPMSIYELWKIGHGLYGTGWRAKLEGRFGLARRSIGFNDPQWLTPGQRLDLRHEYNVHVIG